MSTINRKQAIEQRFARWKARMANLMGSIFWVPIQGEYGIYAHFLADESFAFYDSFTSEELVDFAALVAKPVLFRTHVMGLVHTKRAHKWKRVGSYPIPNALQAPGIYCQMSITSRYSDTQEPVYDYYRSIEGIEDVLITREECEALEESAVWHPLHIQERLRKHYNLQN